MKLNKVFKLVTALVLCQGAGLVGLLFTIDKVVDGGWYRSLTLPYFAPPSQIFGPVWAVLYTLIAVALYLVWRGGLEAKERRFLFWFFIGHLVLNGAWSVIFFGYEAVGWALVDLGLIWLTLGYFMIRVWRIEPQATTVLVPYWLWVTLATGLNFGIWYLN